MSRITDKTIRPIRQPDETRGREQPQRREIPVPPGARVAGTTLTPIQRAENQRLIALYHSLKEKKSGESASQDLEARLKGWKKRVPGKRKNHSEAGEDQQPDSEQDEKQED